MTLTLFGKGFLLVDKFKMHLSVLSLLVGYIILLVFENFVVDRGADVMKYDFHVR